MATPAEIIARWDAREKRAVAAKEAARRAAGPANDNQTREPDGFIDMGDGQPPMAYWLPPDAKDRDRA
jgi:hypothetical protein